MTGFANRIGTQQEIIKEKWNRFNISIIIDIIKNELLEYKLENNKLVIWGKHPYPIVKLIERFNKFKIKYTVHIDLKTKELVFDLE